MSALRVLLSDILIGAALLVIAVARELRGEER